MHRLEGALKQAKSRQKGEGKVCNGWYNDLTTCCMSFSTEKIEQPHPASLNSSHPIISVWVYKHLPAFCHTYMDICICTAISACSTCRSTDWVWRSPRGHGDLGQNPTSAIIGSVDFGFRSGRVLFQLPLQQ